MLRMLYERLDRNWNQDQVARESGLSQQMVSAIERGRINPNDTELAALSRAFGLSPSELLEDVAVRMERVAK
jgi:transcriptional regulator with XRE-family HTH domain